MNELERKRIELDRYCPEPTIDPERLAQFWQEQLDKYAKKPLNIRRTKVETPIAYAEVYDIVYEGFDQTPLHAWYIVPTFTPEKKRPCIVIYQGYTGGRGYPERYASWLLQGYCVLALDVRGQGGDSGNELPSSHGMTKGWISQGILVKEQSYYMAIIIDALKGVDVALEQPETDTDKVVLYGASQGGGLVLAVAAHDARPRCAVAHIPNMCQMDVGVCSSTGSLTELSDFANRFPEHLPTILDNLSFFDNMNLAPRIRIPVQMSACLKDEVCLPKTIFAAYNRMTAPKEIHVHPFLGHSVNEYQNRETIRFIQEQLT